jgi:phage terminase small subunit
VRITKAKDGTPVVVGAREWRKSHRFPAVGKSKKEQLQRKGLLGKIPRSEMLLLTLRQRAALRNFVEAGLDPSKKAECARDAGYSPTTTGQAIDNVLSKPFIRQRIAEALEKAGVSYDKIATVIAEGLKAEHPTAALRFTEDGHFYAPKDYNAIARFLREAIDLHDLRPETKVYKQVDKRTVTIHLTAADDEALEKYRRMRKEAALEASIHGA